MPQNSKIKLKYDLILSCAAVNHLLPVQVVDDVRVLVFPHHQNLVDDEFLLGLLLQVHLLNGNLREKRT